MQKHLLIFRGKDIALKPKCGWLMEMEARQAVFQSLARRLNNDLKEEISLWCQPAASPQQRGRGVDGSEGVTSALPLQQQWKCTG